MSVEHIPAAPLTTNASPMPGRAIVVPERGGWTGVAMTEWELTAAEWTDRHPFDEYNFVLAGALHVESEGVVAIAEVGDVVRVTAGSIGRYWAPAYARMLSIYAPNPLGEASEAHGLRSLAEDT